MENTLGLVVENEHVVVSSVKVAEAFHKNHKNVLRSIEALREKEKFFDKNFFKSAYISERGKEYTDYKMTRDGFMLVVMGFTGSEALEVKIKFIEAFDAMEAALKNLSNQLIDFNDQASVARQLIAVCTNFLEADAERKALAAQLEIAAPKIQLADAISVADTDIYIGNFAMILKQNGIPMGRTRLFEWLRENNWLTKAEYNKNLPTQKAMELELFRIKESTYTTNGRTMIGTTTFMTPKGQRYFLEMFLKNSPMNQLTMSYEEPVVQTVNTISVGKPAITKERIEKYLKMPIPDAWENFSIDERRIYTETYLDATDMVGNVREHVCNTEIWCECFGGDISASKAMSHSIGKIMDSMPNWTKDGQKPKTIKFYGLQKSYVLVK